MMHVSFITYFSLVTTCNNQFKVHVVQNAIDLKRWNENCFFFVTTCNKLNDLVLQHYVF
jgi:hypothetical protein